MKKRTMSLITIFLLFFTSCGDNQETNKAENTSQSNQTTETISPESTPKTETTVIGNLEIAAADNPVNLKWFKAAEACTQMGDGWRLPTIDELKIMYENREKIGGFQEYGTYWSSTNEATEAMVLTFHNGNYFMMDKAYYEYNFRAVRDK